MYLPREPLTEFLKKIGLGDINHKLYVSSDSGAAKYTGKLFNVALNNEKVLPNEMIHTGDNHWSDITIPKRLGIETRHFTKTSLTAHERDISRRSKKNGIGNSYLAGISRKFRVTLPGSSQLEPEIENLITGTISPFLVSFASWIIKNAIASGIKRLYFVARDGEILFKISKQLLGSDNSIELRYLYGSRKAWLVPSITRKSTHWKQLLITAGQRNSCLDIFLRLGLSDSQIEQVRKTLELTDEQLKLSLNYNSAHLFLEKLFSHPSASEIIYENSATSRRTALAYFQQEGLLDNTPWALVDIGWSLNCQAALKRILEEELNRNLEITGYYLGLVRNHLSFSVAGKAQCFISDLNSIFSRRRVILEHCFTPSTHSTTISYRTMDDGKILPRFGEECRTLFELQYAQRLHQIVEHASIEYTQDHQVKKIINTYGTLIKSNASRLLQFPDKKEAALLANFGTVADLRHEHNFVQPLCRKLHIRDVCAILMVTLSRRHSFAVPAFMWLEGSAALSPSYVRIPIFLMLKVDAFLNWLKKWKPRS